MGRRTGRGGAGARVGGTAVAVLALFGTTEIGAGAQEAPPEARRGAVVDTLHGVPVPDPYRWMEDLDSPELKGWVRAQDAFARAWVAEAPGREALARRVAGLAEAGVSTAPVLRGERYFVGHTRATGAQLEISILVREGFDSPDRVLVDREEHLRATGRAPARFAPGPRGRLLAFGSTAEGGVWETVRVMDVDSGEILPDSVPGLHVRLAGIVWARDASGFYYVRYRRSGEGAGATVSDPELRFHRLGTPAADDPVVYRSPPGTDAFLGLVASPDGDLLVLPERRGSRTDGRVLVRDRDDPGAPTRELVPEGRGTYTFAGQAGDTLWFRTDADAPNGRVVAAVVGDGGDPTWREVVPEADATISTWSGVAPLGVAVVGERILVTYVDRGVLSPVLFRRDGTRVGPVELPYPGSLWSGVVGDPARDEAFFVLSGLADPGSVYRLDPATGALDLFAPADLPAVPGLEDVETTVVEIPASDGALIPTFVVRRKDVPLDGSAALVMYGYGFGGWNAAPWFQPAMASFVAGGGVWALPVLRGDGGYGSAWHLAGRATEKERTVLDYVEVARWLVGEGYTSRDRLVANASSAGGAVALAALAREPDLFAAGVLDFPLVDLLRYHEFGYGSQWATEYGTVEDPGQFRVLRDLSPLHGLGTGRCRPPVLVAPGENDGVAPPFHAYKAVAALQHAGSCDGPSLLRVSWGAGHAAGRDVEASMGTWIDELSFLRRVLPGDAFGGGG